ILPIYEGTNGIQALDLVLRKIGRDGGTAMHDWINEQASLLQELEQAHGMDFSIISERLNSAFEALKGATGTIQAAAQNKEADIMGAVAHPYLTLAGHVMAGAMLARAALVVREMIRG